MKLVQDLGEDAFPEETATAAEDADKGHTVEKQEPLSNDPATHEAAAPVAAETESSEELKVTTVQRKPLKVPDTVHVRITPENLKEYVGPPVYYRDRMYIRPPPPGVSTGLGYLGNGSGAVMPIEATVRRPLVSW